MVRRNVGAPPEFAVLAGDGVGKKEHSPSYLPSPGSQLPDLTALHVQAAVNGLVPYDNCADHELLKTKGVAPRRDGAAAIVPAQLQPLTA